jgi:hypothetical protein
MLCVIDISTLNKTYLIWFVQINYAWKGFTFQHSIILRANEGYKKLHS